MLHQLATQLESDAKSQSKSASESKLELKLELKLENAYLENLPHDSTSMSSYTSVRLVRALNLDLPTSSLHFPLLHSSRFRSLHRQRKFAFIYISVVQCS